MNEPNVISAKNMREALAMPSSGVNAHRADSYGSGSDWYGAGCDTSEQAEHVLLSGSWPMGEQRAQDILARVAKASAPQTQAVGKARQWNNSRGRVAPHRVYTGKAHAARWGRAPVKQPEVVWITIQISATWDTPADFMLRAGAGAVVAYRALQRAGVPVGLIAAGATGDTFEEGPALNLFTITLARPGQRLSERQALAVGGMGATLRLAVFRMMDAQRWPVSDSRGRAVRMQENPMWQESLESRFRGRIVFTQSPESARTDGDAINDVDRIIEEATQ